MVNLLKKSKGVTLIEVLLVSAIVGVITTISLGLYNDVDFSINQAAKLQNVDKAVSKIQDLLSDDILCRSSLGGLNPTASPSIDLLKDTGADGPPMTIYSKGTEIESDGYKISDISLTEYRPLSSQHGIGTLTITLNSSFEKVSHKTAIRSFYLDIILGANPGPSAGLITACSSLSGEQVGRGSQWQLDSASPKFGLRNIYLGAINQDVTDTFYGKLLVSGGMAINGKTYLKKTDKNIYCLGPAECNPPNGIVSSSPDKFYYAIGKDAGKQAATPGLYIGKRAGFTNRSPQLTDDHNFMIGPQAGENVKGVGNIFLGRKAGQNYEGNNTVIVSHEGAKSSKGEGDTYIGNLTGFHNFESLALDNGSPIYSPTTSIGKIQSFGRRLKIENNKVIGGVVNIGHPRPIDENSDVGAITNIGSSLNSKPTVYEYVTTIGHGTAEGPSFRKSTFIGNNAGGSCYDSVSNTYSYSNTEKVVIVNSYGLADGCFKDFTNSVAIHSFLAESNELQRGDKNVFINYMPGGGMFAAVPESHTETNRNIIIGRMPGQIPFSPVLNDTISIDGWFTAQLNGGHYDVTIGKYQYNGTNWVPWDNMFSVNTYSGRCTIDGDANCTATESIASLGCTVSGGLYCSSDKRLKTNIKKLDFVSEKLQSISGKSYFWKTDLKKKLFGLIAQEVEKVFPQFVTKNEKGRLFLDYSHFWSILLKASQEQVEYIEEIKNQCGVKTIKDYEQVILRRSKLLKKAEALLARTQNL